GPGSMSKDSDYKRAEKHLSSIDNKWSSLVKKVGPCTLTPHPEHAPYEGIIRAITSQKLSDAATNSIINKFCTQCSDNDEFPTPKQIMETDVETLHECGFSKLKSQEIHIVAEAALNKQIPSKSEIEKMSEEELMESLSKIKGVKRWTIEMYSIFTLGRLDIMPADDSTLKNEAKEFFGLSSKPQTEEVEKLTKPCKPYRTIAAWYLWQIPKLHRKGQ
uniref:Probable DNA-3-methyladenine glycosylase 2 n=1 Tax=Schizosaccharomyces pombe (strain 972 / ATCC 24843) TaxID=284812 RepID=UPI0002AB7F93|nr:Chain A, Probable DNA-3-methyladenine glycosylase 2 [Schizosaccharomyces pombe 972h-]